MPYLNRECDADGNDDGDDNGDGDDDEDDDDDDNDHYQSKHSQIHFVYTVYRWGIFRQTSFFDLFWLTL